VVWREDIVKYLLVFNPKAKRYSRTSEAMLVKQAVKLLSGTVAVTYTTLQADRPGAHCDIADFARHSHDSDCVIAVGGDGTINIVISALARHGLLPHIPLGVIPYGTGNNLVRSFGVERDSEKALVTIRQGYTTRLDISLVNQEYYGVNVSFGLFPYLLARRVTNSLVGYTYEAIRHLGFQPWPLRIRYTDAVGHTVTLPSQRYIVGALLNTSHYGSILRMAPDVVSDDGLFDVKLIRATPRVLYPLVFTIILTGQYELSRHTTTLRATRVELLPEAVCGVEMDGDVIPSRQRYCIEIAGHVRLLVPAPHGRDERSYAVS
jgi:diacylglycerol kinase (ATP)